MEMRFARAGFAIHDFDGKEGPPHVEKEQLFKPVFSDHGLLEVAEKRLLILLRVVPSLVSLEE